MSSRDRVSRQTLYSWKEKGEEALQGVFTPKEQRAEQGLQVERAVLTLLTEGHASYRGIQVCLESLLGLHVSIGMITNIVQQAGKRAQEWLAHHLPKGMRALALDEQYGSKRGEAYLNIVDVQSGLVVASVPPVAVDGESWTLLLWLIQEQGLEWQTIVCDGGRAIQDGVQKVSPDQVYQRDVWHVLDECRKVQRRLDRQVEQWQKQAKIVERQAARIATGQKPRGVNPKTDVQAHQVLTSRAEYVASALRYLTGELQQLLEVVVLVTTPEPSLLSSHQRQEELDAFLALLAELCQEAPAEMRSQIDGLHRHVELALPHLVAFAERLDALQQKACQDIGSQAVHLIGWAWLRRAILGQRSQLLVADFPQEWHESVSALLSAWDQTVRASSCVENWHSIIRPFLAVHRSLSAGMLALLALWHNHRVAPRGSHVGQSPMQRSGLQKQPTDWLVPLGYPPAIPVARRLVSLKPEQEILAA
jgi:hypothetical protein